MYDYTLSLIPSSPKIVPGNILSASFCIFPPPFVKLIISSYNVILQYCFFFSNHFQHSQHFIIYFLYFPFTFYYFLLFVEFHKTHPLWHIHNFPFDKTYPNPPTYRPFSIVLKQYALFDHRSAYRS